MYRNKHRCTCCGRTNDQRLIQYTDEFTLGPFYKDKRGKYPWDVVCADCLNSINEINRPFNEKEEFDEQFFYLNY